MFRIPLNFTPESGWEEASPQSSSWDGPQAPEKILPFPGSRERPRNTQRRDNDRAPDGAVKRDAGTGAGTRAEGSARPRGAEVRRDGGVAAHDDESHVTGQRRLARAWL